MIQYDRLDYGKEIMERKGMNERKGKGRKGTKERKGKI